jgi:Rrf2 family protein
MYFTKTTEYSLRIFSYMINSDLQVFTAKHLVEKLQIPDKYLRGLLTKLTKAGFIKSIQGREGGYVFAKNANKIFLSDIINAVEGMDKYEGCILGFEHCGKKHVCALHYKWVPIREKILDFLKTTTVADLKNLNNEQLRF